MWDLGGQTRLRKLWQHYYENADSVVYVVDSNDTERLEEASEELHSMLSDSRLDKASLLIFANKQDLPNAQSVAEVANQLKLHSLRNRQWHIQACCATTGDGLYQGFEWLSKAIKSAK